MATDKLTVHGVFMEVIGIGVLLTGGAAVGKSELALELITRGHRLIADDATEFTRSSDNNLRGSCPPLLSDFLEVRGLGILNIRAMFGDSAIKIRKRLNLIINLQEMTSQELNEIDRLQGSLTTTELMGVTVPQVTLPVAPGRELAILVETAARQYIQRLRGYHANEEFVTRQQASIDEKQ